MSAFLCALYFHFCYPQRVNAELQRELKVATVTKLRTLRSVSLDAYLNSKTLV